MTLLFVRQVSIVILFLFSSSMTFAQWGGPTVAGVGSTIYSYDDGIYYGVPNWVITNGTWSAPAYDGDTGYSVTITWTAPGPGTIQFRNKAVVISTLSVSVCTAPANPTGSFNYTSQCPGQGQPASVLITRTGTPPAGVEWHWFDQYGSTDLGTSSSITGTQFQTFILMAYSGGCWSNGSLTTNEIPTAPWSVTSGISACAGTSVTLTAGGNSLRWYDACTGGTQVGTGNSFTTPTLTTGTRSYWVCSFSSGIEGPRIQASVTGLIAPSPVPATATPTYICGSGNVTLSTTGNEANTAYLWYTSSSGGSALTQTTQPISSTTTFWVGGQNVNTYCTSARTPVTVNFYPLPTTAAAGADQNLCGVTSTTLGANTPSVGTGSWSILSGAGGSFGNSASASSTFSGTAGTTYTLRWTTSNSPCSSSIDDVVITFTARNTYTVQMNAPSEICAGTTTITPVVTVAGQYGNLTYRWFINDAPQPGSTSSIIVNATPGVRIYCEVSSDGCANSPVNTSPVYIIPSPTTPTAANAGPDQTGSTTCGLTSVALNANVPSSGSGSWSIISGAGGSFVNSSNASSIFNGTSGSSYVLRWTISLGACPSNSDDVNITFNRLPTTANAGLDLISSATCGLTSISLAANTPTVGTGSWSFVSGLNASLTSSSNPTTTLTGTPGTTYVLRWTISNGPCTSSTDDVSITFNMNPTGANAGLDLTGVETCGITTVNLAGNIPFVGAGLWSIISGTGGSFGATNTATTSVRNSPFNGVAGSTYTLRWTISNSPCVSSSDDMIVSFNNNPTTADAGSDQTGATTCGLTSVTLAANSPAVGVGLWSILSGANGSFGVANTTTSAVSNSTFNGISGSTYTLRWTVTNSPCASSSDDVIITLSKIPTVSTSPSAQSICSGQSMATINSTNPNSVAGTTFNWTVSAPAGTNGASPGSGTSITQSLLNTTSSDQTVIYSITPTASGCVGTPSTSTLTIKPIPVLSSFLNPPSIASGTTFEYSPTSSTAGATFTWSRSVVAGINQMASSGSASVSELLTNLTMTAIPVTYVYTLTVNGCAGTQNVVVSVLSPPYPNENYLIAYSVLNPSITDPATIDALPVTQRSETIQYFDGLGRAKQTISVKGSPAAHDVVQPIVYDGFGREAKKYLPFVYGNSGSYIDNTTIIDSNNNFSGVAQPFYSTSTDKVADDSSPYAQTIFEPSPLNRVIKQGAPGAAWQPNNPAGDIYSTIDNTVKKRYLTNQANEVLLFSYDAATGLVMASTGAAPLYYDANQLQVNLTMDEHNNEVIEYTDKEGHTVCKKVYVETINSIKQYAYTYYIYDDFGNLVVVIPPEAIKSSLSAFTQDIR